MSELTQSLQQEYRQMGEIQIQRVVQNGALQHSTIELSHLSQAMPQGITLATPIQMAVATQSLGAAADGDLQAAQVLTTQPQNTTASQQVITTPQAIVVSGNQVQTIPVSLAAGFLQRTWANFS